VDLTRIDGIDVMVAQTLVSEVGLDVSRWKTESHFASWLGLCPDNRISGDKVLSRGTRRVINRAATALRQAANTLIRSRSYLGAQYRRLRTKLGAPKAITAMAHRLARLVYRMLKHGQAYVDKGSQYYEERYRQQQICLLRKRAAKLGLQIMEMRAGMVFGERRCQEQTLPKADPHPSNRNSGARRHPRLGKRRPNPGALVLGTPTRTLSKVEGEALRKDAFVLVAPLFTLRSGVPGNLTLLGWGAACGSKEENMSQSRAARLTSMP